MLLWNPVQKTKIFNLLTVVTALVVTQAAQARLFSNSYVSFELPETWDCKLDGTEYVCASRLAKQAKEAIIILTAKEAGPTDSLALYKTHLETPKSVPDKNGKLVPSKKLNVSQVMLNNHPWIDSLHMGSEINSYYTRYLATVKDNLAILVTFSAHKEHFTKYSQDFLNAVKSLRVLAARDSTRPTTAPGFGPGEQDGPIGPGPIGQGPLATPDPITIPTESEGPGITDKIIALFLLLAAVGYYLWKKKKG